MSTIAVVGEAVADAVAVPGAEPGAVRLEVRPGGSPANTAVALARLGAEVRFFGRLSEGVLGRLLREHLEESGVDLSHAAPDRREATLAIAALDEAGQASYGFYLDGTADWHWSPAELAPVARSPIVHTGSLALLRPPGAAVIVEALRGLRSGTTVSIDPNVRPAIGTAEQYRHGLDEWAGLADILKLSADDLGFTYPDTDFWWLSKRWHAMGCRLVVLTRGGDGAIASLDGQRLEVAAPPTTVADTIGAGDAFTAGLLYRLAESGHGGGRLDRLDAATLLGALELANLVAARTCEVPGANPPWSGQLNRRG